jgi:uncharacterized repeat protein (TIGR03943 family)
MSKIGGVAEGLILLVIGCYAGALVFGDEYWRFLNPRFKWLTGLTAAMFLATGAVAVWKPGRKSGLSRIVVFLLFISLLGIEIHARELRDAKTRPSSRSLSAPEQAPRVTLDGVEYVRINIAELFLQCEKRQPGLSDQRFVTMGMVKRNAEMDRLGQILLVRKMVTCCVADAIGASLRVQVEGQEQPLDGQWVEVYGRVKDAREPSSETRLGIEGMRLVAICQSCRLIPTGIHPVAEPDIPFIFEIRESEPYAY